MLVIIWLLVSSSQQLTYDSGFFEGFSQECKTGYSTKSTITFHGSFQDGADFRVNVENVKTTSNNRIISSNLGFDLFLSCHSTTQLWTVKYYWYAIDDKRIQVINNFNDLTPDNQVFDHQIPNANFGILSVISFGETDDIDFQIQISSITKTQVSVSITKVTGKFENLIQLGYQIILGIDEAFLNTEIKHLTSTYNSGTLTQYPNRWLFLGYNGHQQINMSFRQKFVRTSISQAYSVQTWYGSFVIAYHVKSWVAYQFTTTFKAFEYYTLRISQLFSLDYLINPQTYIDIGEINQSFSSSTYLIIDKSINNLTVKIYMKCFPKKKIVSKFLKCQSCSSSKQYTQLQHQCHGTINEINYFPKFSINQSVYKELNIEILADKITVTQLLRNKSIQTQILIDVQILDS